MQHILYDYSKKTEEELTEMLTRMRKHSVHAYQYNQQMLVDQLNDAITMVQEELRDRERVRNDARAKKEKKNIATDTITLGEIYDGPEDVHDFKF